MKTRLLPTLACILLATITTFAQPTDKQPRHVETALHLFTEPGAAFSLQVSPAPVVAAAVAEMELELAKVPAGMIRSEEESKSGKSRRWALIIGGAAAAVTGSAILLSSGGGSGGGTSIPGPPQRP